MVFLLTLLLLAPQQPTYVHPSGWAIATVKPAADLTRWNKFENAMNTCPVCMEQAVGQFKTFRRFWVNGVHHWWAFALDIPHGMGLLVEQGAVLEMTVAHKGDTTLVASTELVFPIGWAPRPQHAQRSTLTGPVYVHPAPSGSGAGGNDYEWVRFRSDLPKYYVLAYARYTKVPKGTKVQWRLLGVTSYER